MIDIAGLREDKRPQSSTIVHALLDRLEAAEKERADVARQLVQSEQGKRKISEECDALREDSDTHKALIDLFRAEIGGLRTKIAEMERQEPVAWRWELKTGEYTYGDKPEHAGKNARIVPLYALPGAQNVPEKLCYDSRWEIAIDYVDGWNAAVDMMRGKSPSWHCPDCCIAFPFGAPKSCPNDDARCNRLLTAAPRQEAKP